MSFANNTDRSAGVPDVELKERSQGPPKRGAQHEQIQQQRKQVEIITVERWTNKEQQRRIPAQLWETTPDDAS